MPQPLQVARPPASVAYPPTAIRVLIADGHGLARAGLRLLLEREPDLRVVGEASSGEEAVELTVELEPDVVLIDHDVPGLGGVDATRLLLARACPGRVRVLMLMGSGSEERVFGALRAGATGLLLRDSPGSRLPEAVRVVADGEALLAPSLTRKLIGGFLAQPERLDSAPDRLEELTPREREVVGLVACGLSNREIADRLVVSGATAKTHVSRALRKLAARDRAQLVAMAYEAGIVRPFPARPTVVSAVPAPAFASRPRRGHLRPVAA